MTRRLIGPFNRVEGDLEISLEIEDERVQAAYVNAPLFRGFEQMLPGKDPADAMVFVPRICGICSVAQSAAAAAALGAAAGVSPPPNGRLAGNLTLAAESAADHLTHFYLFFMPDFANAHYAGRPWHEAAVQRFRAMSGTAAAPLLAARTAFLHVMSLLAGKWPHTLTLQPGGSSRSLQASERIRLYRMLREFRDFLERTVFDDTLERVAELADREQLAAWAEPRAERADFARFLTIATDLKLEQSGRTAHEFLSSGAYPTEEGHWFARGVFGSAPRPLDPGAITEDVSHARYLPTDQGLPPGRGATHPHADKAGAYSWCKAPRLEGRVVETGALARQVVAGHPLALDLIAGGGGSVSARVIARLLELARLVPAMESWTQALRPGEPYHTAVGLPETGEGVGLVEAARGSLGHWLSIRRGRLHSYQIIAPTTWNFSPRDAEGTPGAVEQALVGTPARAAGAVHPAIYHVVRSFDPCMVCTVH